MRRFIVLFAPVLMLSAQPKDSCPFGPMVSPRDQQLAINHTLSVAAEAVAPSGRRRAGPIPSKPANPFPIVNVIDADVYAKMSADGVSPTGLAGDEEFLRRVTLDLTGAIPDTAAVTAFTADTAADKRTKKITELLASDAFIDRWTMWFGDLVQNVQVSTNSREYFSGRNVYYNWIKQSFKDSMPYDEMVRQVLAGVGDSFAAGTPNYVVRQLQPNGPAQDTLDNLATHSGERFLGVPLLCLSCHNGFGHLETVNTYLASKKRADLWSMSAFFAKTRAQGMPDPNNPNVRKFMVDDAAVNNQYYLNTTSGNKTARCTVDSTGKCPSGAPAYASPAFIFTGEAPRAGEPLRNAYGRMLTADRQFARATVNYIWKEMFGVGIVEPANNIDLNRLDAKSLPQGFTLQPTNPQLLEDLTTSFINSKYSVRELLRTIAASTTYQLSSRYTPGAWNEVWTPDYARHYPRRLSAEMLLDAITKSTSVPLSITVNGIGAVTKMMQLPDTTEGGRTNNARILDEFGRGDRDETARTNDSSIVQALTLLNDQIIVTRVRKATAGSTVAKTLASTSDPATIVDQLYLMTLSRKPTATERTTAVAYLKSGNLNQKTEDLQFTLINSLEFLFN
jgi:hypothetical protein